MSKELQNLKSMLNCKSKPANSVFEATLLNVLLLEKTLPEDLIALIKLKFKTIYDKHKSKIIPGEKEEKYSGAEVPVDVAIAEKYSRKAKNAQSRKIDFTITFSEFKRMMSRKTCAYTGFRLNLDNCDDDLYPTVERVDSTKGYTKENCMVVASKYNQLKNALFENTCSEVHVDIKGVYNMMMKLKELGQV